MGRHDDRNSDRQNERRELEPRRQQPPAAPSWTDRLPGWKLLVLSLVGVILVILAGTGPATYWLPDTDRDSDGLVLPSRDEPDPEPSAEPGVSLTIGPEQSVTPSASVTATPPPGPAQPGPRPAPAPPQPQPPRADRGTPSRPTAPTCFVSYRRTSSWEQGFGVRVDVTNRGKQPIQGWTLRWSFRGDPSIRQLWNAKFSQSGRAVTVRDEGWNGQLQPGQTVQFGFEATAAPLGADPDRFTINGASCQASVTAGPPE